MKDTIVNSAEFENVYKRNYSRTVRALSARGVRGDIAQEFAQSAWARAWERRAQLRQPSRLVEWVNSIAMNAFRSWLRDNPREEPLDVQYSSSATSLIKHRLARQLLQASGRYSRILEAFYFWGYSTEEIADLYNTSPVAIRVRLSRARAALRNVSCKGKRH